MYVLTLDPKEHPPFFVAFQASFFDKNVSRYYFTTLVTDHQATCTKTTRHTIIPILVNSVQNNFMVRFRHMPSFSRKEVQREKSKRVN
jgi:hypothetical protein